MSLYLVVVWVLVFAMIRRQPSVPEQDKPVTACSSGPSRCSPLGDTGHVGFRVMAYASGSLESTIAVAGRESGLVGLGALATAVTVTIFYVLMLVIWHRRYDQALWLVRRLAFRRRGRAPADHALPGQRVEQHRAPAALVALSATYR